jgi:hypothetical protein
VLCAQSKASHACLGNIARASCAGIGAATDWHAIAQPPAAHASAPHAQATQAAPHQPSMPAPHVAPRQLPGSAAASRHLGRDAAESDSFDAGRSAALTLVRGCGLTRWGGGQRTRRVARWDRRHALRSWNHMINPRTECIAQPVAHRHVAAAARLVSRRCCADRCDAAPSKARA